MEKIPRKEFLNDVEVEGCDIILKACFDKQKNGSFNMESNLVSNCGLELDEYEISNLICAAMASRFAAVIESTNEDEFIERMVNVFAGYLKELVQNMAVKRANAKSDKFVDMCKRIVSENACEEWIEKCSLDDWEANRLILEKRLRFEFDYKTRTRLYSTGAITIRDLIRFERTELMKIKGIGKSTVDKVKERLSKYGLTLGMTEKQITQWVKTNKKH